MAKKYVVTLIDDTDGTQVADETVRLALDGVDYTIDLSDANAARLRAALDPWIAKAVRVGIERGKPPTRSVGAKRPPEYLAAVRVWAGSNGHAFSPRGRVSGEILAAYQSRGSSHKGKSVRAVPC